MSSIRLSRSLRDARRRRADERRSTDRSPSRWTSDEAFDTQVRTHQFVAVMRGLPLAGGTALVSTVIIAASTPDFTAGLGPLVWLVGLLTLLAAQAQSWWQWHKAKHRRATSKRTILAMVAHAGGFGALWGILPAWLLTSPGSDHHALLAASLTGMLCLGAVALAALAPAAYAFMAGLTVSVAATALHRSGLQIEPGAIQWAGYVAVMVTCVASLSRAVSGRVEADLNAEQQSQLVGLLLRDFEDKGSDLLWEIDERGFLRHVSSRLAEAMGQDKQDLEGRSMLSTLGKMQKSLSATDRETTCRLSNSLTAGQPFRDVPVPMTVRGKACWWSLTAKPLIDERGLARGWRGVARDITNERLADRRMTWLAHFDTLTGLTNRAHFRVLLGNTVQDVKTGGAVLCMDLDNFKAINDTLGHATGDALLVEVGRRLKAAATSPGDVAGRLGGDEFAMLLTSAADEEQINWAVQHILEGMSEPCVALGAQVHVRISVGIARFPQDGNSVDELMQNADLALYDAKANAPGSARFFAQRMGEQVRRRLVLERDLREALDKQQLSLHYQPKVDLQTWKVTGFEALLRWKHPEHGDIPPVDFIPVAEETGLILQMGEWALRTACRQAVAWPKSLQLAVNISPVQVMAQNLPKTVEEALQASGLHPSRLELEITESVFINETRGTVGRLHALRKLGVQIALDDFGTGYSSLAYLRRFPFDTLKIDRAFVRELLLSRDARSIVRNILALAKSLRMSTVAEGVEEPAQVTVLKTEGCDLVQGYYVSQPMPADEVDGFLRKWRDRPRPVPPSGFLLGNTRMSDLAMTQQLGIEA